MSACGLATLHYLSFVNNSLSRILLPQFLNKETETQKAAMFHSEDSKAEIDRSL